MYWEVLMSSPRGRTSISFAFKKCLPLGYVFPKFIRLRFLKVFINIVIYFWDAYPRPLTSLSITDLFTPFIIFSMSLRRYLSMFDPCISLLYDITFAYAVTVSILSNVLDNLKSHYYVCDMSSRTLHVPIMSCETRNKKFNALPLTRACVHPNYLVLFIISRWAVRPLSFNSLFPPRVQSFTKVTPFHSSTPYTIQIKTLLMPSILTTCLANPFSHLVLLATKRLAAIFSILVVPFFLLVYES